jgi:hypothetical protein
MKSNLLMLKIDPNNFLMENDDRSLDQDFLGLYLYNILYKKK